MQEINNEEEEKSHDKLILQHSFSQHNFIFIDKQDAFALMILGEFWVGRYVTYQLLLSSLLGLDQFKFKK